MPPASFQHLALASLTEDTFIQCCVNVVVASQSEAELYPNIGSTSPLKADLEGGGGEPCTTVAIHTRLHNSLGSPAVII